MSFVCLSDGCTRKTQCDICARSIENYYKQAEDKLVKDAIAVLQSRKYVVIPPNEDKENG